MKHQPVLQILLSHGCLGMVDHLFCLVFNVCWDILTAGRVFEIIGAFWCRICYVIEVHKPQVLKNLGVLLE